LKFTTDGLLALTDLDVVEVAVIGKQAAKGE
jgi:hypothetical protein